MFRSVWLDAFRNLTKSIWSRSWTAQFGPCPNDPVIDLRANSTLGIIILSIAVRIAAWTQVSTAATTLLTSFFVPCPQNFFHWPLSDSDHRTKC